MNSTIVIREWRWDDGYAHEMAKLVIWGTQKNAARVLACHHHFPPDVLMTGKQAQCPYCGAWAVISLRWLEGNTKLSFPWRPLSAPLELLVPLTELTDGLLSGKGRVTAMEHSVSPCEESYCRVWWTSVGEVEAHDTNSRAAEQS